MIDDAPFGIKDGPVTRITLPAKPDVGQVIAVHCEPGGDTLPVYGCNHVEQVLPGTSARFRAIRRLINLPDGDQLVACQWIREQRSSHCLSRDCLRGSPAGDRETALNNPDTVKPAGCECGCAACQPPN